MSKLKPCPLCGKQPFKIIYFGLPAYFCQDEDCNCMYGFWTFILNQMPFNGMLFVYEGNYWSALWTWLTTPPPPDGHV